MSAPPPILDFLAAQRARFEREALAEEVLAGVEALKAEEANRQANALPFGLEREALIYRSGFHQARADHHREEARRWREGEKR